MPPPASDVRSAPAPHGVEASSTVRGIISYLIFLHFFFLVVGIKSNTSSSGFDQDLRNKVPGLRQYIQLLALDSSYLFHLTHYNGEGSIADTDYFFEADIPRSDGSTELVVLKPVGLQLPVREFRYRRLAFNTAGDVVSGNESITSLMPQAIAGRLMLEHKCETLTLRLRRRLLQNLMLPVGDPRAATERSRTPDDPAYFETVYQTLAFRTADGEVDVAQIKEASDQAAPTVPQAGTPPGANNPSPVPSATPSTTAPAATAPPATTGGTRP